MQDLGPRRLGISNKSKQMQRYDVLSAIVSELLPKSRKCGRSTAKQKIYYSQSLFGVSLMALLIFQSTTKYKVCVCREVKARAL